jgi:hypothetical protein
MSKRKEEHRELVLNELDPDIIPPSFENFKTGKNDGGKIVVIGKPGCLAKGTNVRMASGILKKVENVVVGDLLMGDCTADNFRTVLELCRGEDEMYKVVPDDGGMSYVVNKGHILTLFDNISNQLVDMPLTEFLNIENPWRYSGARLDFLYTRPTLTIQSIGHYEYYGFVLDGNHRFLLEDYTITHNTGKCLGENTPVMMADGTLKYVQNVGIGELLMGDDFEPRVVLSTTFGEDNLYLVEQTYGMSYIVNAPHILCLSLNQKEDVLEQAQYFCARQEAFQSIGKCLYGYKVFPEEATRVWENSSINLYSILSSANERGNKLPLEITLNKNPIMRWMALQLLIKFYGSYDEEDNTHYIETKLIWDVYTLGQSLGIKCNILSSNMIKIIVNKREIKDDTPPTVEKYSTLRVSPIGRGKYYGFEISGNKRFLLGDFTVTHNTTLIKSIMYEKQHIFPVAQVYSGTEDSNHFYQSFIPEIFIFNKYMRDKYANFIKRQKIAKKFVTNPNSIVLWDDCTEDPKIFNDPLVFDTYKNGRHRSILHILSLQYCNDIKPVLRTNIDGTFILRESIVRNRESLWRNYGSCVPEFADFNEIMDQVTEDYTALYVNNRTQSNKIEDCLFYYKARTDIPTNWHFGCQEYWDFNNARFDPNFTEVII